MFDLPLVVAIVDTAVFVVATDEDRKGKGPSSGMLGASLAAQFVPALHRQCLVPMILQAIVAIWMALFWKIHT
ncbi:MAG TPA: hypothetical protein VG457_02585 [Planctomycetota bacterium]|nr:hypothetical protein [Planctomycetota bacterium]